MTLPFFVDDIYYEILQELDSSSDISAFMLSSSRLYSLGVDRLLQMGVVISTDDELVSFCHFMRRNFLDMHRTTNQLSRLTIRIVSDSIYLSDYDSDSEIASSVQQQWFDPFEGAPLLVPVLGCITNLESLSLHACEHLLRSDLRLIGAFAAFTSLQELQLRHFGVLSYDLVANLRSPLVFLDIDFKYTIGGYYIDAMDELADPLSLLRLHQNTLQDAVIHYGELTRWMLELSWPRTIYYTFPAVQYLALTSCHLVQRDVLVHAFPNATTLQIFLMSTFTVWEPTGDLMDPDMARDVNINIADWQWNSLRCVVGDVDSLYMLALHPPAAITALDVVCWAFDEVAVRRLHTVIENLRPEGLRLAWGYWDTLRETGTTVVSPEDLEGLLMGLPVEVIDDIYQFGLDIRPTSLNLDASARYMEAISNLVTALPNLRFFSFRLELSTTSYHDQEKEVDAPADALANITSTFTDEALTLWAMRLAEAMQSLEKIYFCVMGRLIGWRVARAGASGSLHPLDPTEVQNLVEAEGTYSRTGGDENAVFRYTVHK